MDRVEPITLKVNFKTGIVRSPFHCKHENGWYDSIKTFFGYKRVFVCSDCETVFDMKEWKQLKGISR